MNIVDIPPVTQDEKDRWPAHGVVKLEKPFVDARGKIQPLVDAMMRSAVMIESKAGSIRANHYHKSDWHYCYHRFYSCFPCSPCRRNECCCNGLRRSCKTKRREIGLDS